MMLAPLVLLSLGVNIVTAVRTPFVAWSSTESVIRLRLPRQHRQTSSWPPHLQPPCLAAATTFTALHSSTTKQSIDETYYSPSSSGSIRNSSIDDNSNSITTTTTTSTTSPQKITLTRWLADKVQAYPELRDMESLHLSIQMACKTISNLITTSTTTASAAAAAAASSASSNNSFFSSSVSTSTSTSTTTTSNSSSSSSGQNISMKRLDQICKNVLQNALRFTGRLRVVEAPDNDADNEYTGYHPRVIIAYALDDIDNRGGGSSSNISSVGSMGASSTPPSADSAKWGKTRRLAAVFDPLDGSGNADADICTGTVFGIFDADAGFKGGEMPNLRDASSLARSVLQPGNKLLAAGYCLYSSTTMLVFTLGGGTHGFTLDPSIQEFVLTHPNMKIPSRGNIYSCNEAYSEGWDGNFQRYLRNLKSGKGETGQRYTQRYIGSMVGDVHRTLTYGGLYCYPSDTDEHPKGQLQLVYKSAPMAYILEHAGGKATNGKINLLDVQPGYVHERSPCFMGSPEDMDELMTYMSNDE
ncbi:hypothetical protein ACHAWU_005780 [Discostella pseudostelligera]|uniref:fructose-bisphosphatase n=1 Tax=Discostella pseudostelligera TaxID=259834 RepID=A0ABD3N5M3_9STRA